MEISKELINKQSRQWLKNLRSFPSGTRNCYTLKPDKGKNNTYLIRASFWYADYDDENRTPVFDLYIDVNYWATIDAFDEVRREIIYVAQRDEIQVCLVNIGQGVPFISALELRPLNNSIYQIERGFLMLGFRDDVGGLNSTIRYPDDVYDRIWESWSPSTWRILKPGKSASDLSNNNDEYKVPGEVLRTAQTNDTMSYTYTPDNVSSKCIGYFHFAETQILPSGQQRELAVSTSNSQFKETVRLEYLKSVTVVSTPVSGSQISFSFEATTRQSGYLPPIINALEIFEIKELPNVPTAQDDVKALISTKAEYTVNKNSWKGDPCVPSKFAWEGLNCSYGNPPRVISLDLSNNQLTGAIPETLANLPKLRILNLSGNKLNGSVPNGLKRSCCIGFSIIRSYLFGHYLVDYEETDKRNLFGTESSERTLGLKNRPFKYGEVSRITGNFEQVIGEGGFGKVYLGTLDNSTIVAVKMLSESSKQGDKEFQAEARLLMIVHHRNLVSLFGYCNESKHMALIYEYMANGNLRQHLSGAFLCPVVLFLLENEIVKLYFVLTAIGKVEIHSIEDHSKVLTWRKRLHIAVDAAQGLDYLHNGCKPPIIHRDLKTTNILLNEDFQAKIGDFGLSRAFATENDIYVSTCPAGTPGYLDPEFQSSGNLTKKSDVYSFGIILFELITGRPAIMRSRDGSASVHILEWLIPIVESGDIHSIMDPRLQGEFDINSAWKLVEIAMSCTRPTAIQRPDINHIWQS
ncbi:hypothetical protein EUGRSUZ_J02705 [Eucalyptus grandis]|uniref:Uncharacterized protein n=1 Tax=Eucalyptus grandis TaxID=71139 RepID=A0ACC3J9H4_EUCGR|nr:hypothetical protein EUGRSUZ_J02705 [Eucalyptus grandis]